MIANHLVRHTDRTKLPPPTGANECRLIACGSRAEERRWPPWHRRCLAAGLLRKRSRQHPRSRSGRPPPPARFSVRTARPETPSRRCGCGSSGFDSRNTRPCARPSASPWISSCGSTVCNRERLRPPNWSRTTTNSSSNGGSPSSLLPATSCRPRRLGGSTIHG